MGIVLFDGQGPYAMPNPQSTNTIAVGSEVAVQIRLLTGSHPSSLAEVVFYLKPNQARVLAQQLNRSVSDIQ